MDAPADKLDSARARSLLLVNLVVVPGLGSFLGRRRWTGIAQMLLAVAAMAGTVYWFASLVRVWIQTQQVPVDGGPDLLVGLLSVVAFAVSWVWGLVTGLQMVRAARARDL